MVTAKERYYYTYRPRKDGKWDCNKWDQMGSEDAPAVVYVVDPFFGGWRGECSCPAFITCKHIKALQEALRGGNENKLPFYKWSEKHGWQEVEL